MRLARDIQYSRLPTWPSRCGCAKTWRVHLAHPRAAYNASLESPTSYHALFWNISYFGICKITHHLIGLMNWQIAIWILWQGNIYGHRPKRKQDQGSKQIRNPLTNICNECLYFKSSVVGGRWIPRSVWVRCQKGKNRDLQNQIGSCEEFVDKKSQKENTSLNFGDWFYIAFFIFALIVVISLLSQ